MIYMYLGLAIVAEVIATTALKASVGFTKLFPSILVTVGYLTAFYFLSLVLKVLPVGITYATWAGLGIVLTTITAALVFKQTPDTPAIIGMLFIITGVAMIHLYSTTAGRGS